MSAIEVAACNSAVCEAACNGGLSSNETLGPTMRQRSDTAKMRSLIFAVRFSMRSSDVDGRADGWLVAFAP